MENVVRHRTLALGVMLGLTAALITGSASAAEMKHSGTITEISGNRITIDEMGPWKGDDKGIVRHSIAIGPDAKIELSERTEQPSTGWPGAFTERTLGPRDLHIGDYVTVTTEEDGGRAVAKSITVTPPADDAPSASILER